MHQVNDKVVPPYTLDQVDSINGYQTSSQFHPFTCVNRHDGNSGTFAPLWEVSVLVADESGLYCLGCDYRQTWVHRFMADGSWKKVPVFGQKP